MKKMLGHDVGRGARAGSGQRGARASVREVGPGKGLGA